MINFHTPQNKAAIQEAKMERKRTPGVTVFAIIFLLIGLWSLSSITLLPLTVMEKKLNSQYLHKAMLIRLDDLRQKGEEISDDKTQEYQQIFDRLENNLKKFEKKFINYKSIRIFSSYFSSEMPVSFCETRPPGGNF